MGSVQDIDQVVLDWEAAYASGYRIEVSDDGATWQTVHSGTGGTGFKQTIPLDADGRHVRVHLRDRSGPYG